MMLLTKANKNALKPLYSTEKVDTDSKPIAVKFFCPWGAASWFAVEGEEQEDGDWLFYGWCDLGNGTPELGYFSLNEMMEVRGPFGLKIERDMHFDAGTTVGQVKAEQGNY